MKKPIDMTGWIMSEHGVPDSKLTVIKQAETYVQPNGRRRVRWFCKCSCGKEIIANSDNIRTGHTKSCGCHMIEKVTITNSKVNMYDLTGEYGVGYDCNGKEFWFDLEDYERIKDYCWLSDNYGSFYTKLKNYNRSISLHRLIMGVIDNPNVVVDHIYHNRYDNRKSQLRVCTQQENICNQKKSICNTSGIKGVYWSNRDNKWKAQIGFNGKVIALGSYVNINDALNARKEAEIKYFGEYRYREVDNRIRDDKTEISMN